MVTTHVKNPQVEDGARPALPPRLSLLIFLLIGGVMGWLTYTAGSLQAQEGNPAGATVPLPAFDGFGLSFINAAETASSPERIQRGIATGAGMDRFPLYWDRIETGYGLFDWSAQDRALGDNHAAGLDTLAILLGTPGHYYPRGRAYVPAPRLGGSFVELAQAESGRMGASCQPWEGPVAPAGLYNPIFADGTDLPAPGKAINPDNYWARFVSLAVARYQPGGEAGVAVRHWQIWNEPDLCHFWSGSAQEYARLLKVAYLVIKQGDPHAVVVWAGLAHFAQPGFLPTLLDTLRADPLAPAHGGFFDAAASHHYSLSWQSFDYTNRVRLALARRGWDDKPIWITESGVPVCDDFPGPACPSPWRATPAEQAAYIWQNIAYTRIAGGTGPIFHFMLHDDCGNVVAVDSPDGFGLVKNEASSFCSPEQATPRPAYRAFQLAIEQLSDTRLIWADIQGGAVRRAAFFHPASGERRTMLWSILPDTGAAGAGVMGNLAPVSGEGATLLGLDGATTPLAAEGGVYAVPLAGGTNRNWPNASGGYDMGIYGPPVLIIERDETPPNVSITPLPPQSAPEFTLQWQATDLGSGVAQVGLWFQRDGGEWQLWAGDLPASGSRLFLGEAGSRYAFTLTALDGAGNARDLGAALAETEIVTAVSAGGRVIDPRGAGVAGALVTIGEEQAITDEAGRFSLTVPVGDWDIRVGEVVVNRGRAFRVDAQLQLLYAPFGNRVMNGDFESGLAGWQVSGSSPLAVEQQPGTQDHALRLATGFVPNPGVPGQDGSHGGNSTVSQRVQVPLGRPYLALAYQVVSQESVAGRDSFEILIAPPGEAPVYLLVRGLSAAWQYAFFDLGPWAGREVDLILNVYQSSPLHPTTARVDNVTLASTLDPATLTHFYLPLLGRGGE